MKTRSIIAILFILLAIAYCAKAATVVVKISQFPNTTAPASSDLFLLASGSTNKNITWNQLKDAIGTNPATVTILNNVYVSNLFATNVYTSNLYATNITVNNFRGRTVITTNLYAEFVTNNYAYITNLYTTLQVTNYYLFTTNIYQSFPTYVNNSYVSNYFQTNAFNNTYVSNYFNTNQFLYLTNIYYYSTNLTVTNFYLTDQYISNFFNTNIFVVDNTVSNFFATNIYNTINISSNYLIQVSAPLTNATLWGTTTFAPESGTASGLVQMYSNGLPTVTISADGAYAALQSVVFKTNRWDGPTNNWPMMNGEEQYYVTYTDINITNFSLLPPTGYGWNGLLVVSNAASTNITFRFPSTFVIPERTTSVTISNASKGMMSGKWSPATGTNGVFRQF